METSVPRQRDASDSVLVDMLMGQAPVGVALFGSDLRFRWVNTTMARYGAHPSGPGAHPSGPGADPSGSGADASAAGTDASAVGGDPAAYVGLRPAEVWPAEIATRVEAALRQILADGKPLVEPGYPPLTGAPQESPEPESAETSQASACASWFPVRDATGEIFGIGLTLLNVAAPDAALAQALTAVAAAQAVTADIRRSEERYRSLVQGGAQVVWVAGPDGATKEDSPEWRWITGQTVQQYLGNGWLEAIHPEDRDRVERDWRECVRTGKVFDDRYRIRTKGGSYRHYDVRAVPIERDGKIAEWVGASTDVTSQREAEEMRGRLTEQLSAAALRTARLQQATSMLAEALTVEQVVEVITEVGRTAIGALRSAVVLIDPDSARLRVINDDLRNAPDSAGGELTLSSPSVITRAIATRRPVLVEDPDDLRRQFEDELEIDPERVAASDERSWVGLPLLAAGAPLGALRFSFGRPRKITEEERVFLEALAGQCQLAVERAGLYEREHKTAETLQRSLLPDQLPSVPGLVLVPKYRPAKNMEIGGDWYDAFRLADHRLAVALGDVMGKGLTAAAGMGRVRNALRALALTDPRPAAVLGGLDRLFSATEQEEQVTTVAYLVIDPETGEGVLGNAGHLPALVLEAGCAPRFDQVEAGTPLGWASPRRQHPFNLRPGSTAIFYSDGLVENRNRGLDAGLEELAAVAARADADVLARPERLLEYLVEHMLAGHEQDDDVTVLVLHVPVGGPW
ncbi:MAG: SpoIIE family protein phosphatase [Streptosporangiaceae bacterium]|jgi:PAS domain S-box-containing protein